MRSLTQTKSSILVILFISLMINTAYCKDTHLRGHIENQNKHLSSSSGRGNPITAVIFGFFCITGAFAMLWYNERRQAITEYRLDGAKKKCTSVDSAEVNPNTNMQLVHTNGESKTNDLVVDAIFGLSVSNCIKLVRTVEMYQWVQKSRTQNNRTEYYYVQEWSSTFHKESGDGHYNDETKWIIKSETQINNKVWIGAYLMSKTLAEQTTASEELTLAINNSTAVCNYFNQQRIFNNFDAAGKYIYFQQVKGIITMNDLRVSFAHSKVGPTTVVSQQVQNTFQPYIIHDKFDSTLANDDNDIENMQCSCTTCCCFCCKFCKALEKPLTEIDWLYETIMTQNQVFKKMAEQYACLTLAQRIGGYVLMGIGFCLIFSPISWLVSWFPLIGNFLATITGFVFFLVSFIISIPFSLITIAFAWLFYHPKYGIALLLLAGAVSAGIYFYLKSQA